MAWDTVIAFAIVIVFVGVVFKLATNSGGRFS